MSTLITLFSSLGRRPGRITATELPPVDSNDFMLAVSGAVNGPLQKGGTAKLLNNGDEFFPAMIAAFESAECSINFLAYIWEPGKASDMVFAALIAAAKRGVQVRLLLDGLGGMKAPEEGIDRLKAAGGKVERFRPPRFGKLARFYRRNHRRAIVIDGKIGYTGGAAVGDKWLGNASNEKEWRDSMTEVTGCIAGNLQSAFAEPWAFTCGEILSGTDYYPEHGADDGEVRHINMVSSPSSEEHPLRLFYVLSFLSARKTCYIASSYFVPDEHTRRAVSTRARAGVDVRVLVPNKLTDARPIRLAGRRYYEELLEAGVRMYEYQPAMMHAKTVVIDSLFSIVGSANMDIRSKELNQENVLGILDHGFACEVETTFLKDLEKADEITLAEWRKRNMWERVKERFWVMWKEQY